MTRITVRLLGLWEAPPQGIDIVVRQQSGKLPLYARLTKSDVDALEAERRKANDPDRSTTLERLLLELFEDSGNGKRKIPMLSTGRTIRGTTYKVSPHVIERLKSLVENSTYTQQMIIRAAIARTIEA